MKKTASLARSLALLSLVACATSALGAGAPLEYIKTRTLQSLSSSPGRFLGHYLAADADGKSLLQPVSSAAEAGAHWELKKAFWKERGYVTYTIIHRGNSRFNGKYLAIDKVTGALVFSDTEIPTARWLIRYAGKFQGWDAVTIQNLAPTGKFDMHFLAIDEATGAVRLDGRLTAGAHWHLSDTPYLPAESLF